MMPLRTTNYLPLALLLAVNLPCLQAQSSPGPATIAEQYLLAAANQERSQRGLPLLHRNPQLAAAAAQHAEQMAEHQSISHQFAGEAELSDRGASANVAFSLISENVAEAPNAAEIHDLWMHSEHHRANLLEPNIDAVGISVIERHGEFYAVEDFARTTPSVSLRDQEAAIASLVENQAPISLIKAPESVAAARDTCSMPNGYSGSRRPWFVMRFTSAGLNEIPAELKTRLASGRYHEAAVGACPNPSLGPFTAYNFAVLLFP